MFSFLCAVVFFFVWIIPVVAIAVSDRTHGAEKLAWLLAVIFISWFAWIFYALLAPLKSQRHSV